MTIKKAAYDVSKYVKLLNWRDSVSELIRSKERYLGEIDADSNHAKLFQQCRQQHRQFAGYLEAISNSHLELTRGTRPLFDIRELISLTAAHFFITNVQAQILSHLGLLDSAFRDLILPYDGLEDHQQLSDFTFDPCDKTIKCLCSEFDKHPALPVLRSSQVSSTSIKNINSLIQHFEIAVTKECCTPSTPEFDRLRLTCKQDHSLNYAVIMALLTLKSSFVNLNQLLFQAFQHEKFPVFNNNNIFDIQRGEHAIAKWIRIESLWTPDVIDVTSIDLVMVDFNFGNCLLKELSKICSVTKSFSQDSGYEMKLCLLVLDDNLCAIPNLLA